MKKILGLVLALCCWGVTLLAQDVTQIRKNKPFAWSGNISAGTDFYGVQGVPPRGSEFAWGLRGAANVAVYGFSMPFSFAVGRQRPEYFGPTFARLGISPTYKWAKVHLGHRNLTFSDYTLAGHTFFGGAVELNPGKFRFAAMYGRFQKPVVEDTTVATFNLPAYRRMGYGAKIGVGTDRSFVDLIVFHASDDTTTAVYPLANYVTPKANTTAGLNARLQLGRYVTWHSSAAVSILTRNLHSQLVPVPDSAAEWIQASAEVGNPRTSTRTNLAGKTGLTVQLGQVLVRADYERIDPEYESLGAYFFQNDLENYTLGLGGAFARGRVVINGNGGIQRNNLLGNRSETTRRMVGNANLAVNPTPFWGFVLNYNNFAVNQAAGRVPLSDTVRLRQINQTFTFVPRLTILRDTTSAHNLTLTASFQNLNDLNPLTRQYANMDVYVAAFNYAYSHLPGQWTLSSGLNLTRVETALLDNLQSGATLGANKMLSGGKFNAGVTTTYNFSRVNGARDGGILSGQLNLSWSPVRRHTLSTYASLLRTTSEQYTSFTEWRGGVNYTVSF